MFAQKRGMSDVVTVSLIILLAIAAVVIVWSFVRPTLEGTGQQVGTANCLAVSIKPVSCDISSDQVVVESGTGSINIEDVKLVFYQTALVGSATTLTETTCVDAANPLKPLSRATCGPVDQVNGVDPVRVAVVPVLVGGIACQPSTDIVACVP